MDFGPLHTFDRAQTHKKLFARLRDLFKQQPARLLGGGEQMLAMARAVAIKPAALFLDEPTEDVQPSMIDLIRDVIIRIKAQNLTVVLVIQRFEPALNITDQVVFMENGRSLETIDTNVLRAEPKKIYRCLGV